MTTEHDYLILGAGPAGLQLGYFLERSKRDYLILEQWHKPGHFFSIFPRHRMLISINKTHTGKTDPELNLRWDWNSLICDDPSLRFANYSQDYFPDAGVLVRYLEDFAQRYQLKIRFNTRATQIERKDGMFVVTDASGNVYSAKRLVVASGFTRSYAPAFPGSDLCETYARHSINVDHYADQRVLVVGKGNSGFETANHIAQKAAVVHIVSPHSVKMAWQTHYVGNLRAVNNNFLDTYQLKSQNTVIDAMITNVEKDGERYIVDIAYTHARGQTRRLMYDKVILCTGFRFDNSIFGESCQPELVFDGRLPAQTAEWESVNIPGLYFAGTLMQACDFKQTMSGFIHGFRHNVQTLSHILDHKYDGIPLPCTTFETGPENVLQQILHRLNNGSGIFLQPGFLQDVVVVKGATSEYYKDIRSHYVPFGPLANNEHYYTLSLEYGHFESDPFSVERDPDPGKAHEASYLHPIIRRYSFGKQVAVHHIQDDLENEWYLEEYISPAREFFEQQFSDELAPA